MRSHDAPREECVAHLLLKAVHRVVVAVNGVGGPVAPGGLNRVRSGHLGGESNESLNCLSVAGNVLEILHKGTAGGVSGNLLYLSSSQRHGDRRLSETCKFERLDQHVICLCFPAHHRFLELSDLGWLALVSFRSMNMGVTVIPRHLNLVSDSCCLVYGFV